MECIITKPRKIQLKFEKNGGLTFGDLWGRMAGVDPLAFPKGKG